MFSNQRIRFLLCCFCFYCHISLLFGSDNKQTSKTISEMFKVLDEKPLSVPVPREIELSNDKTVQLDYYRTREQKFREYEERKKEARQKLVLLGDEVIEPLLERLKSPRTKYLRDQTPLLLREIGTSKAKKILLDIVLGNIKRTWVNREDAAQNLLEIADISDAIKLASSKSIDVFVEVVKRHPSVLVDKCVREKFLELLQSKKYVYRWGVVDVLKQNPKEIPIEDAVHALVNSLQTVNILQGASGRFSHTTVGTLADNTCSRLCLALINLNQADSLIVKKSSQLEGLSLHWINVARANRGDMSVKVNLKDLLSDESLLERTMLRQLAIEAFKRIGIPGDIAFLENLASKDRYVLLNNGGPFLEMIDDKPINNDGNNAVVVFDTMINKDLWENARKYPKYPIKEQIFRIIQTIHQQSNQ